VNRIERFRFGSVGPANPGTEIRIAQDGEILIKGVGVFQGYYKRPEETATVIDHDGWFATGDIGELDPDGFLKITDRKKDLIITAGGKNIAPAYVEGKLKTIPLVSQVIVHGDRRKFLSALVTLNPDEVKKLGLSYEDAVLSPKVRELLEKEIADRNRELESYQQVKKFAILEHDFSIESGELTPSLKVKRKAVSEKFKPLLDRFYAESADSAA
jgi:long-chain acyl-CoA synthetase